jgi:hypothetical protein
MGCTSNQKHQDIADFCDWFSNHQSITQHPQNKLISSWIVVLGYNGWNAFMIICFSSSYMESI